jgi:hypothetical protein
MKTLLIQHNKAIFNLHRVFYEKDPSQRRIFVQNANYRDPECRIAAGYVPPNRKQAKDGKLPVAIVNRIGPEHDAQMVRLSRYLVPAKNAGRSRLNCAAAAADLWSQRRSDGGAGVKAIHTSPREAIKAT